MSLIHLNIDRRVHSAVGQNGRLVPTSQWEYDLILAPNQGLVGIVVGLSKYAIGDRTLRWCGFLFESGLIRSKVGQGSNFRLNLRM